MPAACCSRPSRRRRWRSSSRSPAPTARSLLDDLEGGDRHRRRHGLRPAHPRPGHRRDARLPARGRRPVPRRSSTTRSNRSTSPSRQRIENFAALDAYLTAQIEDHIEHPRDDLTSYLLGAEMDGEPLNAEHVGGAIALLLIAGIDTTWSAIGASLWHLAKTPGRPAAPGRRARAAAHRHGGAAAGLRPGHHGPPRQGGPRVRGLPHEGRATGSCCPSPPPTATPRPSIGPTRSSSTARSTATPPSGSASTAAPGRTWPAWSCGWPSRCGSNGSRASPSADPDAVTWSGGQVRGPRTLPITVG